MQRTHDKTTSTRDRTTARRAWNVSVRESDDNHREGQTARSAFQSRQDDLLGWLVIEKGDRDTFKKLSPVVEHLLSSLSPPEAAVLRFRYGIDDGYPKTHAEISGAMHIATDEVRELEETALSKLYRRIMLNYGTLGYN